MQSLLQEIVSGKVSSFKELFEKFVPVKRAQSPREMWFNSEFDELSPPSKKRKLNPECAAVSDAKEHELKNYIESAMGCASRKRRKRSSSCSRKRYELVEDSIKYRNKKLIFYTYDENGRRKRHRVSMDADRVSLKGYIEEYAANLHESGLLRITEKSLGAYGVVVNALASIKYFSKGEFGKKAFSTFQVAHGLGGLTGLNDIVSTVTKETLGQITATTAERIFGRTAMQTISEVATKAVGESTAKVLGRFASGLPSVGLVLDIYFIASDIKELLDKNSTVPEALRVTHLVLDVATTILGLVDTAVPDLSPVVEPLVIALTVVRLGFDDFYLDIKEELLKVKGKDFGAQLHAFLKGAEEGAFDLLTLGLGRKI